MPRPNTPDNEQAIFKLSEAEARVILPLDPKWSMTGAMVNPEDRSLFLTVRDDGADSDEKLKLSTQRIFIAGDLSPEKTRELDEDMRQFLVQQGVSGVVGFFPDDNDPMQLLECKTGE